MNFKKIKHIHFIGIGGSGMIGIARVLLKKGYKISGSDITNTSELKKLKKSVIKNLVITDTIENQEKTKRAKNIEVLQISSLMGEAIKRISNSTSVSDLFK